jgi:aconitate hydratase
VIDVLPPADLQPQSEARLVITGPDGRRRDIPLVLRIDTPMEVNHFRAGGILPHVLRQLLSA